MGGQARSGFTHEWHDNYGWDVVSGLREKLLQVSRHQGRPDEAWLREHGAQWDQESMTWFVAASRDLHAIGALLYGVVSRGMRWRVFDDTAREQLLAIRPAHLQVLPFDEPTEATPEPTDG